MNRRVLTVGPVTVSHPRSKLLLRALLQSLAVTATAPAALAQDVPGSPAPAPAASAEVDSGGDLPGPAARTNALIGGAAMAIGWYGAGVGTSLLWSDAPGADDLYIPVAGPWMALAQTGCPDSEPDCSIVEVILRATLTTLSGVGQIGGLAIIGEGLFVPVRESSASNAPKLRAHVQPVVAGRDGWGLGVVGTF